MNEEWEERARERREKDGRGEERERERERDVRVNKVYKSHSVVLNLVVLIGSSIYKLKFYL